MKTLKLRISHTVSQKIRQPLSVFFSLGVLSLILTNLAQAALRSPSVQDCLKCHDNHSSKATQISSEKFFNSVHKETTCLACHSVVTAGVAEAVATVAAGGLKTGVFEKSLNGCAYTFKKETQCTRCHAEVAKDHSESVHNSKRLPVGCARCHVEIHAIQSQKNDKLAIAKLCSQCHEHQSAYFKSQHHQAIVEGRNDSATCTDCHGLHAIKKIDNVSQGRLFHTKACLNCHADQAMMTKNKVTAIGPETFFESYHGKNVRLGYPEKVAGCADCHSAHAVLKASDLNSTVHSKNLVKTCAQCHANSSASFVKYLPHAEIRDHKKNPVLFVTFILMATLLVGTFLFFWVHSLLWAVRSYVERRQKARQLAAEHLASDGAGTTADGSLVRSAVHVIQGRKKLYKRFKPIHIYLHIVVIVSFLGLSLTGLPLKFSHTAWGKVLVDAIGGTATAGLIHRVCAVITFGYFFVAIGMSIQFLFFGKNRDKPVLDKLFGPDSLFPNKKDLSDIIAMFQWFFFRGQKPSFERWTYWEKFDFMAVFWGMFAIGSSGLMLWFPEFFGKLLPGWMFNVATIIHSDEALLATGFIFTVHFFNTHFRPEKFPMDFVIFNGEISKEEMIEERADQWRRYEAEGITEEFVVTKPSSLVWDLTLKAFGFLAVIIGLTLAVMMVYTLIAHS